MKEVPAQQWMDHVTVIQGGWAIHATLVSYELRERILKIHFIFSVNLLLQSAKMAFMESYVMIPVCVRITLRVIM